MGGGIFTIQTKWSSHHILAAVLNNEVIVMKTIENQNVSPTDEMQVEADERDNVVIHSAEVFKDNVSKMMELVFDLPCESVDVEIKIILALHNFDLENADLPCSMALKASFHHHMDLEPWGFGDRFEELHCIVLEALDKDDSLNVETAAKVALAVHKNRILTKHFAEIDIEYFGKTRNGTTSIPSDNKQPD